MIKYYSEGFYFTKMIVDYLDDEMNKKREVRRRNETLEIPGLASNIVVRFLVMRFPGIWKHVKKWDREAKAWIHPTEAHIFRLPNSGNYVFTLNGPLYFEAVEKVTNDETGELEDF